MFSCLEQVKGCAHNPVSHPKAKNQKVLVNSPSSSPIVSSHRELVSTTVCCVKRSIGSSNKGQQSSACVGIYIRLITACLVLYTVLQGGGEHPGG